MSTPKNVNEIDFNSTKAQLHRRLRYGKDRITRGVVAVGGIGVIVAILLIFFYLLYEVLPIFRSASIDVGASYALPSVEAGETRYLSVEEQNELGMRITAQGQAVFFKVDSGQTVQQMALPLPEGVTVQRVASAGAGSPVLAAALSNGQVLLFEHQYKLIYPKSGGRVIEPHIEYPYGEQTFSLVSDSTQLSSSNETIQQLAVADDAQSVMLAAVTASGHLQLLRLNKDEDFLTGDLKLTPEYLHVPLSEPQIQGVAINYDQRWVYVAAASNKIDVFDLRGDQPTLHQRISAARPGVTITRLQMLLGNLSLLVGASDGSLSQWFIVNEQDENGEPHKSLKRIRSFDHDASAVMDIQPEHRRKGFAVLNAEGELGLFHSTANRRVLLQAVTDKPAGLVMSPRSDRVLVVTSDQRVIPIAVHNEHPEVSWSALWGKVWYESYDQPDYIWQSSASNDDFEPKFSLTPLAFGTLKAAFYAMLMATPLAICGAIYTAYFMAPSMRRKVKPVIEMMEALPTVILGFMAGLFLAPFVELNLPGIFALLIFIPAAILAFAFTWANMPKNIRLAVPEGWDAALLIPVVLLAGWAAIALSHPLEHWFFGGDMRRWLTHNMGIDFDQRNALVVGLAMGFAVIPTIFSITEDAIFSVPRHLSHGSLALGATPWQTMIRVVLPTASPGIFSAVMIGMGRAVGETMIVLMATGNTPIMDANIFEGMRTLAANIAVEVPESEVGSTHFRILFLAAFVLFMFTFVVNTAAELIRQHLRKKFGSL